MVSKTTRCVMMKLTQSDMTQSIGSRQEAECARFQRRIVSTPSSPLQAVSSRGFTLLEMLVSVFILVLISTILLVSAVSARKQAAVRSAAHQVAGFIREAGNLALNGVKAPGCTPQSRPDCSHYKVVFRVGGDARRYSREALGGGTIVHAVLPAGAVFADPPGLVTTFRYVPPTVTADPSPITIRIEHVTGAPRWLVCVNSFRNVEVRSTGSC